MSIILGNQSMINELLINERAKRHSCKKIKPAYCLLALNPCDDVFSVPEDNTHTAQHKNTTNEE